MRKQTVPFRGDKIIKWFRNPRVIGRRTGLDVKAGKNIRIHPDGFEEFADYFSRSESPSDVDVTGSSEDKLEKSGEAGRLIAKSSPSFANLSLPSEVRTSARRYYQSNQHNTQRTRSQIDLPGQLNFFYDLEDNSSNTKTPHKTGERGLSLELLQKKPVWNPGGEDLDELQEVSSQKFHVNSPRTKASIYRRLSSTTPIKNTREQEKEIRKTPNNLVNISTEVAEGSARSTNQRSAVWQRLYDWISDSDDTNGKTFTHVDEVQGLSTNTRKASKINHIPSPFVERSKTKAEPKQGDINVIRQKENPTLDEVSESPIPQQYQRSVSRCPSSSSEKDDDQETTLIHLKKNRQTSLQMSRGIAEPSSINGYLNGGDDVMGSSTPTNKCRDHGFEDDESRSVADKENDDLFIMQRRNKSISAAEPGRRLLEVINSEDDSFSVGRGFSFVDPSKHKLFSQRETVRNDFKTRARVHDAGKEKNVNSTSERNSPRKSSSQSPGSHSKVSDCFELTNRTKITARKSKNYKPEPAEAKAERGEIPGTSKEKVVPYHNKDSQNQCITEKSHTKSTHEDSYSNAIISNSSPEKRRGAASKRKIRHPSTVTDEQVPSSKKKHYDEMNSSTEDTGKTRRSQRKQRAGLRKKTKQFIQEAEATSDNFYSVQINGIPVRRSRRHRIPTLAFWRLEHVEYTRDSNGLLSFDHIEPGSSGIFQLKRKRRKDHQPCKPLNGFEIPSDNTTLPPDEGNQFVSTVTTVLDHLTGQEIDKEVVHSRKSLVFRDSNDDVASKYTPLSIGRLLDGDSWGCARLKLLPFAKKPVHKLNTDSLVFYVLSGKVNVTIHKSAFILEANDACTVPVGNDYSLKNLSDGTSELLYFIIQKSFNNPK